MIVSSRFKMAFMKSNTLLLTILVPVIWLFLGCNKSKWSYPLHEQITLTNVAYGTDARQQMDVYLPAGRSPNETGIVVLIHGGGWTGGDKSDFQLNAENVKTLELEFPGYALVNLNYRLVSASGNTYPAAVLDIKAAMQHIWEHAEKYGVSSATYLVGASAGAHLAALQALKYNTNGYIRGCVAIAGPYNLTTAYMNSGNETRQILEMFMGGNPSDKRDEYLAASPIHFITVNSPKFLLLHGKSDHLVPASQASEFKAALEAKNVPVRYFTYSGGHGIPPEHLTEALQRIKDFLP